MSAKRIVVPALAVILAGLGTYAWSAGVATMQMLWLIGMGVALSIAYVIRGGTLPETVYRNRTVLHDDDPRNISPFVYLPILLVVLSIAAICYYWGVSG